MHSCIRFDIDNSAAFILFSCIHTFTCIREINFFSMFLLSVHFGALMLSWEEHGPISFVSCTFFTLGIIRTSHVTNIMTCIQYTLIMGELPLHDIPLFKVLNEIEI